MSQTTIDAATLPRCEKLDGSTLRVVAAYTEAGYFCEANRVAVTDGERTADYVPAAYALTADEREVGVNPIAWLAAALEMDDRDDADDIVGAAIEALSPEYFERFKAWRATRDTPAEPAPA